MLIHLNIFTWPPCIAAFLNLGLGVLALERSPRNAVHRAFAAWNFGMAVWNFNNFLLYTTPDPIAALNHTIWSRDVMVFIYALFFHFILRFIDDQKPLHRSLLMLAYATGALFALANHRDGLFIQGLKSFYWGFYPIAGPIGKLFPLCFNFYVWYAMFLLYRCARNNTGFRRNQCWLLFLATLLVFSSALTNFLVVLGVAIYPFGNVINIVYSLLIAYAVVTYGLMDIQMVFRKGFAYAVLASGMTGTYVLIVSLIKQMFLQHDSLSVSYAYHLAAVPLTVALAPRLRSTIEPWVRRMPLWRTYDYEEIVKEFGQNILTTLDLKDLARSLVAQLSRLLGVDEVALYVRSAGQDALEACAWVGRSPAPKLSREQPEIAYLTDHPVLLHRERMLWEAEHLSHETLPTKLIDSLKTSAWGIAAPLFSRDLLIGVLCLGPKRSGDMYNSEDLSLLDTLLCQITVAVSNARAIRLVEDQQRQLEHQREMAVMGNLATEMAHELSKPLTHIMNEGARLEDIVTGISKKNLNKIEKEAQRAAEILDGFAMLSPERPLHRIAVSLADLLEEALETLGLEDSETLSVVRRYEKLPPLYVNPGQIVQVFTNLIQNAAQAMPDGGVLTLSLGRIATHGEVWAKIRITDTGPGIPADVLPRVFKPFFTTKKAQGGRGVGLTLSRAMVERHGGTIRLESPLGPQGGGTRITVSLPWETKGNRHAA